MHSLLLCTATRIITPLQILFSVIILLRGHNEPGGGFIGGLVAAVGVILYGVAYGMPSAERMVWVSPRALIGIGLLVAGLSGVPGLFLDMPYMTGLWSSAAIPTLVAGTVKIGTPFVFDTGVYLVVIGIALLMTFSMAESPEDDTV